VRDVARSEHVVPFVGIDLRFADLEGGVPLEDPEAFVLSVVAV